MEQLPLMTEVSAKFEDVEMYFHSLIIERYYEGLKSDAVTAFANVWQNMNIYHSNGGTELVGDLQIAFRNQGADVDNCLFLTGNVSASSKIDKEANSVFCKLIQFLFERVKMYIEDNRIIDRSGKLFVLPAFQYSKEHFKSFTESVLS